MKKLFLLVALGCAAVGLRAETHTVTVDPKAVVSTNFLGFGVQWSAYPWFDITDDDWQRVYDRLDYMRVPLVRLMTRSYTYCLGFDTNGTPIYDWDNNRMQKMYRLLDYCQRRSVKVILGEWDHPSSKEDRPDLETDKLQQYGMIEDDPRWHRIICDLLDHLYAKGYTCIVYYNLLNEPNSKSSGCGDFGRWKTAITGLNAEFTKRGLAKKLQIVGPDVTFLPRDGYWLDLSVLQARDQLAAYEFHAYADFEDIESGYYEKFFSLKRDFIYRYDPKGRAKPFFMGEVGMSRTGPVEPQGGSDSHPKIYDHIYGVWMADYNIQCARAGMGGTVAWMLDDAMHINKDKDTAWPDVTRTKFKKWGFFNSLAEEIGHPDDANLRPWFFTWSLMSRCHPPGATILGSKYPAVAGLRAMAARIGAKDYTFTLVNDSDAALDVKLVMPGVAALKLRQYDYFATERLTDELGFPKAKRVLAAADIAAGLPLSLPKRSVVVLTTLE